MLNRAEIITGPVGKDGKYTWSRPLRFLVWLAQWCVHNVFLVYAGTAFVIIGKDPHCEGAAERLPAYCGGGMPTMLQRIWHIYYRMGFFCHVVALGFYLLPMVVSVRKDKPSEKPKSG